jgi:hypothetical protein
VESHACIGSLPTFVHTTEGKIVEKHLPSENTTKSHMGKKCNCCRWAVHQRCKFGHQKYGLETSRAFHRNTYQKFPNKPTPYTTKKHIWLHSLLKVGQKLNNESPLSPWVVEDQFDQGLCLEMLTFVFFVCSNICCTLLLLMEPMSKNFTTWGINFEFCTQSGKEHCF